MLKKIIVVLSLIVVITLSHYFFADKIASLSEIPFFTTEESKLERQIHAQQVEKEFDDIQTLYMHEGTPDVRPSLAGEVSLTSTTTTNDSNLGGKLYFSGKKQGSDDSVNIYSANLTDDVFTPKKYLEDYNMSAMVAFKGSNSSVSDSFFVAFTGKPVSNKPDLLGIHYYDVQTQESTLLKSAKGSAERHLTWSDTNGYLAYSRILSGKNQYSDLLQIDNWEVVIYDPVEDRIEYTIPKAIQPQWSPDGERLLFLMKDGLYSWDFTSQKTEKIIGLQENASVITTSMIDVSPDGQYLLWTTAKKGIIDMFKLNTWSAADVVHIMRIEQPETEFYWPTFSPDGRYFAVQAIDAAMGAHTPRQNPRMEVRSTSDTEVIKQFSLKGFNFDQLFTDTWVR